MPQSAREYLRHRFRGDADALRERVTAMQRGSKLPGPDAATSRKMADACEDVVTMLDSVAAHEDAAAELVGIVALVPQLEQKARDTATLPPVRAVYAGAATRIREVQDAEATASHADDAPDADDDALGEESEDDFDGDADDFIDDDDLAD
ncbi:hypothetical protein [Gemmatimonas phototrophica]|uniref:Uncharacterized protein n=1 Tax=Gemmatimonas phototrophica TaxID=1379270 RepID=A0A143BKA9_9BACT|nr:hypothetical protein [Gemmatimonas phototrophica]AMW05458.1 hypothetical protein GEMMAAP_12885 [Gemmatimonas phototrophica]